VRKKRMHARVQREMISHASEIDTHLAGLRSRLSTAIRAIARNREDSRASLDGLSRTVLRQAETSGDDSRKKVAPNFPTRARLGINLASLKAGRALSFS